MSGTTLVSVTGNLLRSPNLRRSDAMDVEEDESLESDSELSQEETRKRAENATQSLKNALFPAQVPVQRQPKPTQKHSPQSTVHFKINRMKGTCEEFDLLLIRLYPERYYVWEDPKTDHQLQNRRPYLALLQDSWAGRLPSTGTCVVENVEECSDRVMNFVTKPEFEFNLAYNVLMECLKRAAEEYKSSSEKHKTRTHTAFVKGNADCPLDLRAYAYNFCNDPAQSYSLFLCYLAYLEWLAWCCYPRSSKQLFLFRSLCFNEVYHPLVQKEGCRFYLDLDVAKDADKNRDPLGACSDLRRFLKGCRESLKVPQRELCHSSVSLRSVRMGAHVVFTDLANAYRDSPDYLVGMELFVAEVNSALKEISHAAFPHLHGLYSSTDWGCVKGGTLSFPRFFSAKDRKDRNPSSLMKTEMEKAYGNKYVLTTLEDFADHPYKGDAEPDERHKEAWRRALRSQYVKHSFLYCQKSQQRMVEMSSIKQGLREEDLEHLRNAFETTTGQQPRSRIALANQDREARRLRMERQMASIMQRMGQKDNYYGLDRTKGATHAPLPSVVRTSVELAVNNSLDQSLMKEEICAELNKHYRYLCYMSPPLVAMRIEDKVHRHQLVYTFVKIQEFKDSLRDCYFTLDEEKNKRLFFSNAWLDHPKRETLRYPVFCPSDDPDEVPEDTLNLWTGWRWSVEELKRCYSQATEEQMRIVRMLNRHSYEVLCGKDQNQFLFLYCLLAKKFRNPRWRPVCALVFSGPEGTGKSMFVDNVGSYAGRHGAKLTHIKQLFARFNGQTEGKVFVNLDEASIKWSTQYHDELKAYVTSDRHSVERKGKEHVEYELCSLLCITSNHYRAVPFGPNERRFVVFKVAHKCHRNARTEHYDYFKELHQARDEEFFILKAWLSQFHDRDMIPDSLLDKFGTFGVSNFPSRSLDFIRDNVALAGTSWVMKFHENCLRQGCYYPPLSDPLLNRPPPWTRHLEDEKLFPLNQLTQEKWNEWKTDANWKPRPPPRTELSKQVLDMLDEGMDWGDCDSLWLSWLFLDPKSDDDWLGYHSSQLVYQKFCEWAKTSGQKKVTGFKEFMDETSRCLGEGSCVLTEEVVDRTWSKLRDVRATCQSEKTWQTIKYHCWRYKDMTRLAADKVVYFDCGSLDQARRLFYGCTGMDTSPDNKYHKEDMNTLTRSVYNDPEAKRAFQAFGLNE